MGGKGLVAVVSHCALGQFVLSFQFCSRLREGTRQPQSSQTLGPKTGSSL